MPISDQNPPPTFRRQQDLLLAHRPPRFWLERAMQAGFSVPDLGPQPASAPVRVAPPPPPPSLDLLAQRFQGHPAAVALAQALWLGKCAQRHLRLGRLRSAQALLARARAAKPDFFPLYAIHGALLRELALAGGGSNRLHQAQGMFEAMPRRMGLLGLGLGLDQCGALVLAEWAAICQLQGDMTGAVLRLDQALAAQERGLALPDELRQFLLESGCLADAAAARDLARTRRRLTAA